MKSPPRKSKPEEEKIEFGIDLTEKFREIDCPRLPIIKILSSEPKPGYSWAGNLNANKDISNITIHIIFENFDKTAAINKVFIKNESIDSEILLALNDVFKKYNAITVFKLEYCNLIYKDIETLQYILGNYSNITDLSLDGTIIKQQNFGQVLFESNIKYLSLKHCKINSIGIQNLCQKLAYNGSELAILNLTGNYIDDTAIEYLANILRENRKITSLILADNWITDKGCRILMDVLVKFHLNHEEIVRKREMNLQYLLQKMTLTKEFSKSRQNKSESIRRVSSSKTNKKKSSKTEKTSKDLTSNTLIFESESIRRVNSSKTNKKKSSKTEKSSKDLTSNTLSFEKHLQVYLENNLPPNNHPFVANTENNNGEIYCLGNFALTHLNLAYNKIQRTGFQYIMNTLNYQIGGYNESSTGLLYLILDGNQDDCCELEEIKELIDQKWRLLHVSKISLRRSSLRPLA